MPPHIVILQTLMNACTFLAPLILALMMKVGCATSRTGPHCRPPPQPPNPPARARGRSPYRAQLAIGACVFWKSVRSPWDFLSVNGPSISTAISAHLTAASVVIQRHGALVSTSTVVAATWLHALIMPAKRSSSPSARTQRTHMLYHHGACCTTKQQQGGLPRCT